MITNQEFIVTWTCADGETAAYRTFDIYKDAEDWLEYLNSPEHFAYLSIVIKRV